MAVWTSKPGFPLITVSVERQLEVAGTHVGFDLVLQKTRYFSSPTEQDHEDSIDYPIWLAIRIHGRIKRYLFPRKEIVIRLKNTHFYKINVDHCGFYRTTYPQPTLERFALQSTANELTASDKAGIVADATALCFSGHQSTVGLLALLLNMREEPD